MNTQKYEQSGRLITQKYVQKVEDTLRLVKPRATTQRIIRYFPDVHLGNSHRGLSELALKSGVNITKLSIGEYVVFVNKRQTALKMFAFGNVVAHLKMPHGTRLDPRIITLIPRFFTGRGIDYDGAMEHVIRKEFGM